MPYVPPHLRNKQSDSASASEPAPSGSRPEGSSLPRNSSYGQRLESAPSGGFGRQQSSGLPRTSSSQSFHDGGRSGGYGRGAPVEPIFANWQPTQRVLSLSDETIQEIRQRFKVTVEVTPGQPKAAAPIESFQEMVSSNMVWLGISHNYALAARRSSPVMALCNYKSLKQCILSVDRSDYAAGAVFASLRGSRVWELGLAAHESDNMSPLLHAEPAPQHFGGHRSPQVRGPDAHSGAGAADRAVGVRHPGVCGDRKRQNSLVLDSHDPALPQPATPAARGRPHGPGAGPHP